MKRIFLFFALGCALMTCFGVNYTSNQNGVWNNPNVWTPNGVPGMNDVIKLNHAVDFTGWNPTYPAPVYVSGSSARFDFPGDLNNTDVSFYCSEGSIVVKGKINVKRIEKDGAGNKIVTISAKTAAGILQPISVESFATGTVKWYIECSTMTVTGVTMDDNAYVRVMGNFVSPGMTVKGELNVDGSWTTSSAVQMISDGVIKVGGLMDVSGSFNINTTANVSVGGNLKVSGTLTNDNILTVGGDVTVNQMTLNGNNPSVTTIGGKFTVQTNGDQTLDGHLYVSGGVALNGNLICNANAILVSQKPIVFAAGKTSSGCAGKLPITLLDFTAQQQGAEIQLTWQTLSEQSNHYFTLERSFEGATFDRISEVEGAGTSLARNEYQFADKTPAEGTNYYRLRQTDYDGKSEIVSKVKTVQFQSEKLSTFSVNPSLILQGESIICSFGAETASGLELISPDGHVVAYYSIAGSSSVQISTGDLHSGMYFLRLTSTKEIKSFIVK